MVGLENEPERAFEDVDGGQHSLSLGQGEWVSPLW